LKNLLGKPGNGFRYGIATLAGLLLALAFPKFSIAGLAWIAPGLMLVAAVGTSGSLAFALGFWAGFVKGLVSLYWLLDIPVMKLAPIAGWLALAAFLALYSGLWVWLCWKTFLGPAATPHLELMKERPPGVNETGLAARGSMLLDQVLSSNWSQRARWALSCAAIWVGLEMVQARFLSGFPWGLLGVSQYRLLPLIQIAKLVGVYGLSFLVVWLSVSLLCATVMVLRRPWNAQRWFGEIILPLAAVVASITFGLRSFFHEPPPAATLKLALVQPSIPQRWIWDPAETSKRFQQLLELSENALASRPDVLIWPEAAVPGYLRWTTNVHNAVTNLVRQHHAWLILGADDAEPAADRRHPDRYEVFNSSFLVSPNGELLANYRKRRLVIFGEYIPFARWLPFVERWTGLGSFTPGIKPVPFQIVPFQFKTSVLICFEDVFPHYVREYVEPDTDFLLNLTNNGWFGESAAQWQHAANAIFRAIENGLPLVRCANNGLTCWVDARGQMHDVFFPGTRDIYGAGFKIVEVPLLGGQPRTPTFYTNHGDVFGWACVAWAAAIAARCLVRRSAERKVR
jgi:apolipoprotein N-acyltransferase